MENMKFQKILPAVMLAMSVSSCAYDPPVATDPSKQIIGSWNCQYEIEENGAKVSMETEDTYVRSGRSNSFGLLKAKFSPEFPELEYSIAGSASWQITDGYLVSTLDDIKIVNLSHPGLDQVLKLQDMFPTNMSDSSEILELSDDSLTLKSESGGEIYHCTRKYPNS